MKNKKKKSKDGAKALFFVGPHLVFFTVFTLIPFVFGIIVSFTQWDLMGEMKFVGFENYADIFTPGTVYNRDFINGLSHTLLFTAVTVPLIIIVPLILAVFLNKLRHGKSVYQALIYAPSLLSVAAVALMWRWLVDREMGAVNNLFMLDINWVRDHPWLCIFMLTLWSGLGGNLVIFLAGLSGIPQSYYDAAEIDGANGMQRFFRITLPELRPQLLFTTVLGTIGGFNVFGQPYMFGGPEDKTSVLMMYIQKYVFGQSTPAAGIASAMSVVLGLIIAVFGFAQLMLMRRRDDK